MNNNTLNIRQFTQNDLSVVLDLHQKAMEVIDVYIPGPINDDLKDIFQNYINNGGDFLVGTINNQIVTIGALRRIDDNICEIKRMRTYPEYQGKGYGTQILHKLINIAKLNKYREIILDTSDKQIAANKMYIKNGFKEYSRGISHGFNCIFYKKEL